MPKTSLLCRNSVTFSKSGTFDDDAYRQFLQRFVEADIGIYIGALMGQVAFLQTYRHFFQLVFALTLVHRCSGTVARAPFTLQ